MRWGVIRKRNRQWVRWMSSGKEKDCNTNRARLVPGSRMYFEQCLYCYPKLQLTYEGLLSYSYRILRSLTILLHYKVSRDYEVPKASGEQK